MAEEKSQQTTGFIEIFLSKLKEQSFIIVLMILGLYFQNESFNQRIDSHKATIEKQQQYIDKLIADERNRLMEREKYLIEQRDKYVVEVLEELRNKK